MVKHKFNLKEAVQHWIDEINPLLDSTKYPWTQLEKLWGRVIDVDCKTLSSEDANALLSRLRILYVLKGGWKVFAIRHGTTYSLEFWAPSWMLTGTKVAKA